LTGRLLRCLDFGKILLDALELTIYGVVLSVAAVDL
jgi:hypothetical protein